MERTNIKMAFTSLKVLSLALLAIMAIAVQHAEAKRAAGGKVFMCYWGTWSIYRPNPYKFDASNIDANMCSHIIYSFAGLNNQTSQIGSLDPWCDYQSGECEIMENGAEMCGGLNTIRQTVNLKSSNPDLKVLIGVGGWNQGSERFSVMAANSTKRATFIQSVLNFIIRFELDGLDLDWEYPTQREGSSPDDYQNFPILLREIRERFDAAEAVIGRELELVAAVAAGIETIEESYDIPQISLYLDYINVMAYDFKMWLAGEWELLGHHSPLYPKDWEDAGNKSLSASAAVQYYLDNGAQAEKLVLGMGAYGRTFQLQSIDQFDFYDPAAGPGAAQTISQTPGTIFHNEICETESKYTFYFDNDYLVPYATDGSIWIGFDDEQSVVEKVDYAENLSLGGVMMWSIDSDDFHNFCGNSYPRALGPAIRERLNQHANSTRINRRAR